MVQKERSIRIGQGSMRNREEPTYNTQTDSRLEGTQMRDVRQRAQPQFAGSAPFSVKCAVTYWRGIV